MRVQRVGQSGGVEVRTRGAHERIGVKRTASPPPARHVLPDPLATSRVRRPSLAPSLPRISAASYVLVFASSSAHAVATPELGILSPREVAHPPASINCR